MNLKVVYNPGDGTFDVIDLATSFYYDTGHADADLAQEWINGYKAGTGNQPVMKAAYLTNLRENRGAVPDAEVRLRHMKRGGVDATPIADEVQEALNRRAD